MALGSTVAELEERLSASEMMEWQEYFSLYPIGADRNEIQLAVLIQTMINLNSKQKVNYKDFILSHKEDKTSTPTGQDLENYILKMMG